MADTDDEDPQSTQTRLPGFGRPLNYVPDGKHWDYVDELFPNALSMIDVKFGLFRQPMITLRESTMLQFMNSITDKTDWHIKVKDEKIVQKWKDEAMASTRDMTSKMLDWCIDELCYKAALIPPAPAIPPPIVVYNGDVVKSDFAVSAELKVELQEAVTAFEEKIPSRLKDWHPDSKEQVWDLVHPSLFPLVYGYTRVLVNSETTTLDDCIKRCGEGETAGIPPAKDTTERPRPKDPTRHVLHIDYDDCLVQKPFSAKFQWLPCEVDIASDEARITTYINNLHPEEKNLYRIISKLITASIPLWDKTLAPLRGFDRRPRIAYTEVLYDPDRYGPRTDGRPQREDGEDFHDFLVREDRWWMSVRKLVLPDVGEFEPLPEPPKFSLKDRYAERGLQVIVKLANIELTPEKPTYGGGSWHVEGQLNEHIVASAIYYYSCENVTTSRLSFRQQCDDNDRRNETIKYEQWDIEWLTKVFGCEQEGFCVQELGSVATHEGRLLTFPNTLQHRVGPFKLEDPTKPGHRKIVALFLVDPNIKVISTAHVPCQRQDWWWEETLRLSMNDDPLLSGLNGIASLPRELQDEIVQQMDSSDFPMSLEEAKRLRLDLMKERKKYVKKNRAAFEEFNVFNLCEH